MSTSMSNTCILRIQLSVIIYGEFDPGSELTLVACLTHASRTGSIVFKTSVKKTIVIVANGCVTRE